MLREGLVVAILLLSGLPGEATAARDGPLVFYSYNYPTYTIGVNDNAEAYIAEDLDLSSFFLVSPGVTGELGTVSFESKTKPGHYLRHSGYVLWLHPYKYTKLYREDATFWPRKDWFYPGCTAYESYNFPNHFIRHQNYRLRISQDDNSELLHMDASFIVYGADTVRDGPFTFYSYNYPTYTMGVNDDAEAYIAEDLDLSSFFLVSPGLTGELGTVSFESKTKPAHYLRHSGYVLWLNPYKNVELYREDATFWPRKDLFYPGYTVYESSNFPNHFIRHQNYRLRISREDNSELLHKDASFIEYGADAVRTGPLVFYSYNYPTYTMGVNDNAEAYIAEGSDLSSFVLVSPGLSGEPGTVSFESKTKPGQYLRHSGYVLWLHPYKNVKLYREDATFWPRRDRFYPGYTVYESYNFPNYFIRHQNYRLKISQDDNSELLHMDASFIEYGADTVRDGPLVFYSYNYPTHTMGVNDEAEAYIAKDLDLSSFFLVSPGLSGELGTVSFESKTKPRHYLRHAGYVLWLHPYKNIKLYREDATFWPQRDWFYPGYTAYESYNYPNHFIRHQNYRLKISQDDNSELLHKDASFIQYGAGTVRNGPFAFFSYNYPTYTMGVKYNAEAYIVQGLGVSKFFLVSPGLTGEPGTVSFESETKPGQYLRHAGYVLWLHPYKDTKLFREDATFWPQKDMFYQGYTVYESYNFPNHFIRHQNYRLKISREDNSELLHMDSSFMEI